MNATWATSTVGEQFDVQLGKMLDAAKNVGVPKPYLGNRAVQWGRVDISAGGVVPMTRSDLQRYRLRGGDLLVCEGGDVGRGAIWKNELPECYYQKALHRLRAKNGYDARLMLAFLAYWSSTGAFADFVTQTSIAHLPREKFVQMPLPLPSEVEQRRIGDVLQDADDLISAIERLIAKKQAIKQGLMQQLLTGRTRLPGFNSPWSWITVGEVSEFLTGYPFESASFAAAGIRLIRGSNVKRGQLDWSPEIAVYWAKCDPGLRAFALRDGDIVIAMDGALVGRSFARITDAQLPAYLVQRVARLRGKAVDQDLLYQWISSQAFSKHVNDVKTHTAIPHISPRDIRDFRISIPVDVNEQRALAGVLGDADLQIELLKSRLTKARAIKVGMMQQLLTGRTRLPEADVS